MKINLFLRLKLSGDSVSYSTRLSVKTLKKKVHKIKFYYVIDKQATCQEDLSEEIFVIHRKSWYLC